jgi:copper chaperone
METLKFKTNINCSGCVAKVTSKLNEEGSIKNWNVDTDNPNKILTVEAEGLTVEEIISTIEKAGFNAKKL